MHLPVAILVSTILVLVSAPAFGCSCAPPPPGARTARELAEWTARGSETIFEGKVESVEFGWKPVQAPVGDIVPADLNQDPPQMLVSFDVSRSYRGEQRKQVQIRTGLGGGDCGFDFELGKQYLVYASRNELGDLETGICTGTELLEDSRANVAYLRGDPVIPSIDKKDVGIATGKLCGRVIGIGRVNSADNRVLFFKDGGRSPVPSYESKPGRDGSFCARDLVPGRYHLLFVKGMEEGPTAFAFFPGVTKLTEATAIEVKSGQTVSGLVFKVPVQSTYAVSGKVSTSDNSQLSAEGKVALMSAEQPLIPLMYAQDVGPDGSVIFPHVLPGKYWAFVIVESDASAIEESRWSTRKVEFKVDGNVTDLFLELIPD